MPHVTVILHNIRSTHNVGAIFRNCDGFGVNEIIISGYTPYPRLPKDSRLPHIADKLTAQIHKTALGAEQSIPFVLFTSMNEVFDYLGKTPVVALEQAARSIDIRTYAPPSRFALLLGEEVDGIELQALDRCQDIVEIPMRGDKESFNVSVAAGIALYALTT